MPTLMVVDDREENRSFLSDVLGSSGYKVVTADSALSAMSMLPDRPVDAIITDLLMPGIDGYEFARRLRTNPKTAEIPIIFWTGAFTRKSSRTLAEQCGVSDFLAKPTSPEAVLDTVRRVVNGQARKGQLERAKEFDEEHAQVLSDKIFAQIRELEAANHRLRTSEEQLHLLGERLRSAQEEERTRLSRHLHDEMGQRLTALRMLLAWIQRQVSVDPSPAGIEIASKMSLSLTMIDEMIRIVQKISTDLRPGILDFGIGPAIEWLSEQFQDRSGITCAVEVPENEEAVNERLDPARATEIYRIFQEALTNIARHSGATRVDVRLKREPESIILNVHDNGKGITPEEISGRTAIGLLGMRERTALIGGDLSFHADNGTLVRLEVPLSAHAAAGR